MNCNRASIQRVLLKELKRRKALYENVREEFRIVISEVPAALPNPDGTSRITIAGTRNNSALHSYMDAVRDLNAFIVRGVVPPYLR